MEQTILKQRFPHIELSYETDAHKKVLNSKYDVCVSIPTGKKYFAWFTYKPGGANDACYVIDKQGIQFVEVSVDIHESSKTQSLYYETVVYGTICELSTHKFFVIEDIHYFCGLNLKQMTFAERMFYVGKMLSSLSSKEDIPSNPDLMTFTLPYMAPIDVEATPDILSNPIFYDSMILKTAYQTHHVQFRSSNHIVPYLNHNYKKGAAKNTIPLVRSLGPLGPLETNVDLVPRKDIDYSAAARKREAVFLVSADTDDDIYHLFCYDNRSADNYTYMDLAYIGTRKESKYMNSQFRNIRENGNVDLGEESEDEELFQNVNPDKYVDLSKKVKMNCVFQNRWRRWTPVSVVSDKARVTNINELVCGSKKRNY
jgi:hypothetical protein